MNSLKNKTILVTGGCGSIGSEIVKKLLTFDVKLIKVFDINETELFYLENEIGDKPVEYIIGDIRDINRLDEVMDNIDIVFHAAALKHVPLCEYNPFEAVKTNIIGLNNLINSSIKNNVKIFVNISTDKSINPISVMGATKMIGERIISSQAGVKTRFCSVRFGNVIGSRGSLYPIFEKQIEKYGKIFVTDMKMKRYMMEIDDAVSLVIKASMMCSGGEVYILKMNEYSIGDIANKISKTRNVPIEIIGNRGNEKISEELFMEDEKNRLIEHKNMYEVKK